MKKNILFLILLALLLNSCDCNKSKCPVASCNTEKVDNSYLIYSVLWYQKSGEFRALCYQAFNTAKLQLDNYLANNKNDKKKAIITDIDETVLDNSPLEAKLIKENIEYSDKEWMKWSDLAKAKPVPGAVEFFNYAKSKGVEIFYVTNREMNSKMNEKAATLKNLKELNFPDAKEENLLMKIDKSSKEERRLKIAENYEIIMLLGDNLNDFDKIFEDRGKDFAFANTDKMQAEFGKKFIILPNPMYGYWEKPIYEGKKNISQEEKLELMKKNLLK